MEKKRIVKKKTQKITDKKEERRRHRNIKEKCKRRKNKTRI